MRYIPVIGLEAHVELKTKSKMFCGCSGDYFGKEPNTHTCPVCLGLPGALPVPNELAIDWCRKIGLALNCELPQKSKFDRKNYFYPDLAKGYQISQYDQPFCIKGKITLDSGKVIGITRVHMEEDTGKLTHQGNASLIDFNRSGVPLVEIVTEPDFDNVLDVVDYLKKLQQIVRYLRVSNADMEKGDMRLEPNISLRLQGTAGPRRGGGQFELPNYKVEVKNINSFNFVAKAIEYEIKRQAEILDKGEMPAQETRGFSENKSITVSQRSKEEAQDYRYFPEPDIPEIRISADQIDQMKSELPELPETKKKKFVEDLKIKPADAKILSESKQLAEFFESAVEHGKKHDVSVQEIVNYIINRKPDLEKNLPTQIVEDLKGKKVGLISDQSEIEKIVKEVLEENPKLVEEFKAGKEAVVQVFIGNVMKKSQGKADASKVKEILIRMLNPDVST